MSNLREGSVSRLVHKNYQFVAVVLCNTGKQSYSDCPKWGPALPLLA